MFDGQRFVETTSRLGYPGASSLKGSEFDWLFDAAPENLHLLHFFCHRVNHNNVLTPEEVQAFRVLRESGKPILDDATLQDLLKTCRPNEGIGGARGSLPTLCGEGDVSLEDLEAELQALRKEKQLKVRRLKKLQVLAATCGGNLSAAQTLHQEGIDKAKDANSALAVENAATNASLEGLVKETTKLAGLYHTEILSINKSDGAVPLASHSGPSVLLSELPLEPYLRQQEQNTKALATYTQQQFFQGISDMVETSTSKRFRPMELSCCSEGEEEEDEKVVESRRKEMAQLQWAYMVAQYQLLQEQAKVQGDQALKEWLTEHLSSQTQHLDFLQASWREPALRSELMSIQSDLDALMCDTVRLALRDSSRLLNVPVVRGDLALQIARQSYYTAQQAEVRDQLLCQKASFELVRMAQDAELRGGNRTVTQLEKVVQRLEAAAEISAQRGSSLTQPELTQTPCLGPRAKTKVIGSKDAAFSRLLQILELGKVSQCKDPLQTYGKLESEASCLHEEIVSVQEALDRASCEQSYAHARLERDCDTVEHTAYSQIVQPLLRPQVRATAAPAQDLCPHAQELSVLLSELEEKQKSLYKLLQDIVGDLRIKRAQLEQSTTLRRERELYVYFHMNPKLLIKTVKEMEAGPGVNRLNK